MPPKRSSTSTEIGGRARALRTPAAMRGRVGVGPEVAQRGRAALDLGDRAEAGRGEGVPKPHRARPFENAASSSSRAAAAPESIASRASSSPSRRSSARPRGGDRAGRVQQDRVAPAAVRPGEDVADRLGVLGRRAAAQLGRIAARRCRARAGRARARAPRRRRPRRRGSGRRARARRSRPRRGRRRRARAPSCASTSAIVRTSAGA